MASSTLMDTSGLAAFGLVMVFVFERISVRRFPMQFLASIVLVHHKVPFVAPRPPHDSPFQTVSRGGGVNRNTPGQPLHQSSILCDYNADAGRSRNPGSAGTPPCRVGTPLWSGGTD